jgi:predicted metal-dependent RNase
MNIEGKEEILEVNFKITTIPGLTAHAGRNELLDFISKVNPKPMK